CDLRRLRSSRRLRRGRCSDGLRRLKAGEGRGVTSARSALRSRGVGAPALRDPPPRRGDADRAPTPQMECGYPAETPAVTDAPAREARRVTSQHAQQPPPFVETDAKGDQQQGDGEGRESQRK